MIMIKIVVLFALAIINFNCCNAIISEVVDILELTEDVEGTVLKIWDFVEKLEGKHKTDQVLQKVNVMLKEIERADIMHQNLAAWTIESVKSAAQLNERAELQFHQMNDIINRIAVRFKRMQQLVEHKDSLEDETLIKFAEWTVLPNEHSINNNLELMSLIFIGSAERSRSSNYLLNIISQQLKKNKNQVCDTQQSAQQFLFSIYSDIGLTELKGYSMMQFSWMILRLYGRGNFTQEATIMRANFEARGKRTQTVLKNAMKTAERVVWRCDPDKHVDNVTYTEITKLLQGYIENESDLNSDNTCKQTCEDFTYTKSYGCAYSDEFCGKQSKCTGNILNCEYYAYTLNPCLSTNPKRRYDYVEYDDGSLLGKETSCSKKRTAKSWIRGFVRCSYCFCICDEVSSKSDRYFNMRQVVSNTSANMVVTGLRFRKVSRIVHLQIQEAILGPHGVVDPNSVRWQPINGYNILDSGIRENRDYFQMAWAKRSVDLDDLHSNDDELVTGVRFRIVGTHLNLEIRLTKFDFETGTLSIPQDHWISNDNTDHSTESRQRINLGGLDIPNRSPTPSTVYSNHNKFVEFTHTSAYRDAAQTTIPFIDMQDVVSKPVVPISGIGIYHKYNLGYGGYIAPRIYTLNLAPHIQTPVF